MIFTVFVQSGIILAPRWLHVRCLFEALAEETQKMDKKEKQVTIFSTLNCFLGVFYCKGFIFTFREIEGCLETY